MKKITLLFLLCLFAVGCIKPHVPDIQQGNILDQTAISNLKIGMTKEDVSNVLGSPVLTNLFDNNCWTYAYTNQINGGKITIQNVTLYFKDNRLVSIQKAKPVVKK